MPTKSGRSVRHMKGGLSEAYSYPSLAQPLLAFSQAGATSGSSSLGHQDFLEHTRGGAGPIQAALRLGGRFTGAPDNACDNGGFAAQPGWFPVPRFTSYRIRPSAHGTVTNSRPGVDRLSCARVRARHARARRGPTPQAAHPAPGLSRATHAHVRAGSGRRGAGGGLSGRTGPPSQKGSGVRPPPGGKVV